MADGTDAIAVRMSGLKDRFAELPDPRSTVNRQHLLVDVVAISVCGVLAGADGPTAIFTWADCAQDWLKKSLELPHGIPSRDCIRRVLQRLQPEAFQSCFAEWLNSLVGPSGAKFLSIDGKTLRRSYGGRSHDEQHQLGALHLVSVWASEQGLTLGQIATAEKSNEITAIPLLLDLVDVKDAIVSIDAMGTQKAIAAKIIDKGGDYQSVEEVGLWSKADCLMPGVAEGLLGTGSRRQEGQCSPERGQGRAGCRIEKLEGPQGREFSRFSGAEQASQDQTEIVSGHRQPVTLVDCLQASQPCPAGTAGFADVGEAAFNTFAAELLQLLAFWTFHAAAVVRDGTDNLVALVRPLPLMR